MEDIKKALGTKTVTIMINTPIKIKETITKIIAITTVITEGKTLEAKRMKTPFPHLELLGLELVTVQNCFSTRRKAR